MEIYKRKHSIAMDRLYIGCCVLMFAAVMTLAIRTWRHETRTAAPVMSFAEVAAGSTDTFGEITATGATAQTVGFATTWATIPFCSIEDESTVRTLRITAMSASGFTIAGLKPGDKARYFCMGR